MAKTRQQILSPTGDHRHEKHAPTHASASSKHPSPRRSARNASPGAVKGEFDCRKGTGCSINFCVGVRVSLKLKRSYQAVATGTDTPLSEDHAVSRYVDASVSVLQPIDSPDQLDKLGGAWIDVRSKKSQKQLSKDAANMPSLQPSPIKVRCSRVHDCCVYYFASSSTF
jgi:hypothetical protein